jgi:hypothetical protein
VGALQLVRDIEAGKLQRLRDVDARVTVLDNTCLGLLDDIARDEALKARLRTEVDELFKKRAELREAIAASAAEHDMVWTDDVPGEVADDVEPPQAAA